MRGDDKTKRLEEQLREARKQIAELESLVASSGSKAAEKLRDSERIVQALLSSSFQSIFLMDRSGILLAANDKFASQFGYEPFGILGRCIYDLLPYHVAERRRAYVEEVIRTARPGRIEDQREGKWLASVVYPIPDSKDGISSVLVYVDDITERKRIEEELEKSNKQLKFILSNSIDAAYLRNLQTDKYDYMSPVIEQLIGFSAEEMMNLKTDKMVELIHPDDRSLISREIESTSNSKKEGGTIEYRLRSKSGHYKWLADHFSQLRDNEGRPLYRVGITRDITKRKQAEEALIASRDALGKAEEKYRNLFLNATEGIFQTSPQGRFLSANPALAHLLGYDSPEQLMKQVTDIRRQVILDDMRSAYPRMVDETGVIRNFECRVRKADGTVLWASLNGRAIRDEKGKVLHYEGTFQDITRRKLARQQLFTQLDLALRLAQITDYEEGLSLILQTALDASGMESGGIWLRKEPSGEFELLSSIGLSGSFKQRAGRLEVGSPAWTFIMEGKNVYRATGENETPLAYQEGFKYAAVVPVLRKDQVIGSISILSRHRGHIPEHGRISLDFLSIESGNIIARMQARQLLEKEVETRREAEKALQAEHDNLQETNTALRVLLRQREADRKELEERLVSNVKQLVLPYVEKLKKSRLDPPSGTMVGFIEANLKEILSPFLDNVQRFDLTPRQIEIVALIRDGRTTKDIAGLLHISKAAVDKHRFLIRKRLGLSNEKTNLRSYLLSLA